MKNNLNIIIISITKFFFKFQPMFTIIIPIIKKIFLSQCPEEKNKQKTKIYNHINKQIYMFITLELFSSDKRS